MASSAEPLSGLHTWNPLLGHVTMVWELRNWMCRIRFGPRQNQIVVFMSLLKVVWKMIIFIWFGSRKWAVSSGSTNLNIKTKRAVLLFLFECKPWGYEIVNSIQPIRFFLANGMEVYD